MVVLGFHGLLGFRGSLVLLLSFYFFALEIAVSSLLRPCFWPVLGCCLFFAFRLCPLSLVVLAFPNLEWKLEENKSAIDGISPAYNFPLVVKLDEMEGFHLKMGIKAITMAGLSIIEKDTKAIHFARNVSVNSLAADVAVE